MLTLLWGTAIPQYIITIRDISVEGIGRLEPAHFIREGIDPPPFLVLKVHFFIAPPFSMTKYNL